MTALSGEAKSVSWQDISAALASDEALLTLGCGDFDVTCAPELAVELAELAASASELPVVGRAAKDFFDCRYGG